MRRPTEPRAAVRMQVISAGVALTLAVSGTAVFTSASGSPRVSSARASADAPSLAQSFALLRQPNTQAPPASLLAAVRKAPAQLGLQIGGARYASSTGAWLIPGDGWLCIATTDSEGLGMSCGAAASAKTGKLAFVVRETQGEGSTVVGAAPDGSNEAAAHASNGAEVARAAVRESTYRLVGDRIAQTALSGPSGTLTPGG